MTDVINDCTVIITIEKIVLYEVRWKTCLLQFIWIVGGAPGFNYNGKSTL